MTEHPHEDVRRLFDVVLDVPAAQRESVLDRECADDEGLKQRILAMIEAAEDGRFLADATSHAMHGSNSAAATIIGTPRERAGERIGHYKLLEQIGEGGFGVVWAAEQREPVKRRVALKIIKLGMDTRQVIARFEAERQALAMMDHPNIAKVLDAGSTETGRPFFVMELVKGVPILDYCDTEKLDTRARLDLFSKVCHAIQHAHQKGIIHRDIKPSNVLITLHDSIPVPKVIDFGIAKATNQELTSKTIYTQHHQMIGTPAYMSPEQAEMSGLDTDTRSDIYALGALLYELLTGTTPFASESLMEAGFAEMMRIIREETPHKPSTRLSSLGDTGTRTAEQRRTDLKKLNLLLRGDLDWIVMKCLEKDRTRRYETASGLAADIRRHLDDEPVQAGPPSARYRLAKFIKRNRGQVIAGAMVAAVLVLGVIGTTGGMVWALDEKARADEAAESERAAKVEAQQSEQRAIEQAERAEEAEADATARAEELELVSNFQSEQLSVIDPQLMGINLRLALLDGVSEDERESLSRALVPVNFTSLALETLEANIFDRAIETIDSQFAGQPVLQARLLHTVVRTLAELGLFARATDPQQRALDLRREHLGDDHPDTLRSIYNMGTVLKQQGRFADAEGYFREAVEAQRRVLGDERRETLATIASIGSLLGSMGRYDEAESYLLEAMEGYQRALGDDNRYTLLTIGEIGAIFDSQSKYDEAESYYRKALEGQRRVLGNDHQDTLTVINNLGSLLESQGKLAEAEPYLRESVEGTRRVLGNKHPLTLASINNFAALLYAQGKLAEAEPHFREGLESTRLVFGDEHPYTLSSINNMGQLLKLQGELHEAEPYLRESMEASRRVLGDQHPSTLSSISSLGALLQAQGRLDEAYSYLREALEGLRLVLGDMHPNTLSAVNNLGGVLASQGKMEEAESYMFEAIDGFREVLGDDHPKTLNSISNFGSMLKSQGRTAEAEPYLQEALEGRRRLLGDEHPNTLLTICSYAGLLNTLGRGPESLELIDEAVETGRRVLSDDNWRLGFAIGIRGQTLHVLGRYDEAAEAMREGYDILNASLGSTHDHTRRQVDWLVALYEQWHAAEPGAGHDASASYWREQLEPGGG